MSCDVMSFGATVQPYFAEEDFVNDSFMSPCGSDRSSQRTSDSLLTPPRSPYSDSCYSCDDDGLYDDVYTVTWTPDAFAAASVAIVSKDDDVGSDSSCSLGLDDSLDFPLLNDCMWSAGLLPPDLRTDAARKSSFETDKKPVITSSAAETICVNPSVVSPYPLLTSISSPSRPLSVPVKQQQVLTSCSGRLTSSAGNSSCSSRSLPDEEEDDENDDDEDDSGEEVDVVSILPHHRQSSYPPASSLVHRLLVLPSSSSVLAQVTAMHNYSSCHIPYQSQSARGATCSAPQSPLSADSHYTDHVELKRSFSTPASPCPSSSRHNRRQKPLRRNVGRRSAVEVDDCNADGAPPQHGGKRALHNVLERRRRDHLKSSFELLRSVVPAMNGDTRMPKVTILRRARDHMRHLCYTSQRLQAEHDRLRSLQQRWQYKLALLTRCSA